MGVSRGYLTSGSCPDGTEQLLKEVIAVPGDQVQVSSDSVVVHSAAGSTTYPAPSHIIDQDGLPVHRFIQNGTYTIDGVWVYGNGDTKYSWDSRYYGAIPLSAITHQLKSLWVF